MNRIPEGAAPCENVGLDPSLPPFGTAPSSRAVRIPLSTGATAAGMLMFGMFALLGTLFALALLVPITRHDPGQELRQRMIWLVPILFFLSSIYFHWRALRARASDVLIDAEGLRIEGGPHDGVRFAWDALDLSGCRTEMNYNLLVQSGNQVTYEQRLILRLRDGRERIVATSLDRSEHDSFSALLSTLQALRSGTGVAAPAPSQDKDRDKDKDKDTDTGKDTNKSEVLTCGGCGAPVVPLDAEVSRCAFCGTASAIPDEVRERVRRGSEAQAAHRRSSARLLRLLSRPRADITNRWLLGALLGKYLAPFVLLFAWKLWLTVLSLVWVLGRVVKMKLSARRVFQRLILDYTATPAAPGKPLLCRRCAGALPPALPQDVLTRCVYCQADNLIGIDIHQRARSEDSKAAQLATLLLHERSAQLGQLFWICVGIGVAIYGVLRS